MILRTRPLSMSFLSTTNILNFLALLSQRKQLTRTVWKTKKQLFKYSKSRNIRMAPTKTLPMRGRIREWVRRKVKRLKSTS